jgi:hypothetical protein
MGLEHVSAVEDDDQVEDDETIESQAAEPEDDEAGETPADPGDGADEEVAAEDAEEVVVSIGEPPAEATQQQDEGKAPEWVRELRKSNREKDRRIRELEQRVAQATPAPTAVIVGTKPTLAGVDYDEAKYEAELEAWHQRKAAADAQQREREQAERKEREAHQARIDAYTKAKATLKVRDFDEAEDIAKSLLSVTQQGIILHGAERPEVLIYALGRNPAKAKELAALSDPVKFAFAVAKLEKDLKVTPRKLPPVPERTLRASAPGATAAVDSQLARLQAEADKTGDRTKVVKYLRAKALGARQAA